MPLQWALVGALLVGITAAKTLALVHTPLIAVNHLAWPAIYLPAKSVGELAFLLALIASAAILSWVYMPGACHLSSRGDPG